jgi:dCTP deaminase
MLLSRPDILRQMEQGNIVIEPFNRLNLGTNSYDITLGEYFFREQEPKGSLPIFNPFSQKGVEAVWGTNSSAAIPYWQFIKELGIIELEGFEQSDSVIFIAPGETILAHTVEFIGGRINCTSEMKARSSLGRCFIEVCKCAGMGDVGYINRWTMEITNNSRFRHLPLKVGMRVGQLKFYQVTPLEDGTGYHSRGKYQIESEVEVLKRSWTPFSMLPKLYKDRELAAVGK